jgi:hypothetical protein
MRALIPDTLRKSGIDSYRRFFSAEKGYKRVVTPLTRSGHCSQENPR